MEQWKDVKNYEGLYQVSNFGRVKRIFFINRQSKMSREKILKPGVVSGYLRVSLWKENKGKNFFVHRLVAQEFIKNDNNYKFINHKDENKHNNRVENLEWCTRKYNNNYGNRNIKISKEVSKPILQYDKNNKLIKEWSSMTEASNSLNINLGNLSTTLHGKQKTCGGYMWKYKIKEGNYE